MITRTMARERPSLFSPPSGQNRPSALAAEGQSPTSPYSLSNEDMHQLTEEFDRDEDLTTSGRTYEELVNNAQQHSQSRAPRDSTMSEETAESDEPSARGRGRQSVGFMLGRNSLSNWSTIGGPAKSNDEDIPRSVGIEHLNTGRKSNVSRPSLGRNSLGIETPNLLGSGHVNVSNRRSNHVNGSRAGQARLSRPSLPGRRSHNLNTSHISSSSSSGVDESTMGESWSPIRTSLENSFANNVATKDDGMGHSPAKSIGQKRSGSLSPIHGRSSRSLSPKKYSPAKENPNGAYPSPKRSPARSQSPTRSPLGDLSPSNRSPNRSPKGASPPRGTKTSPKKKALSPHGTYSLKEAEGARLSLPVARSSPMAGSGSSSGMSVCSGSDTAASSATLLSQSSRTKVALPSLGSIRKASPSMRKSLEAKAAAKESPAVKAVQEKGAEAMLSPDKGGARARGPAPTPNSQRRVIKRFRASVPSANYLQPEDLVEESTEENPMRKTQASKATEAAKPMEVEATTNDAESAYENAFEFPSDAIPLPRTKTLKLFRDGAVANGDPSHQYQLDRAGTNLLSLQEVILPSIAYETHAVLKRRQAIAQRNVKDGMPDSQGKDVVEAIETCRKVVNRCTGEAAKVAGASWREREKQRGQARLERLEKAEAQRKADEKQARRERKAARARSRRERHERQKRDRQRSHPRNKELWQEVARLMVDIQKLEKEERLWKEALVEVNRLEEHHQPPERMELDVVVEVDTRLAKDVEKAGLESTATTLVEDVTLAAERINWTLNAVSTAMEESDRLRREAFDKYQYDGHKLYGYPGTDDSKGLFMALSMESPLRRE